MQKRILIIRRRYTKTSIGNGRSSTNIDDDLGNWHIEKLLRLDSKLVLSASSTKNLKLGQSNVGKEARTRAYNTIIQHKL